jgi:hypothetical protein
MIKSIEELKSFYDTILMSDLTKLEEARKKIANKIVMLYLGLGLAITVSIILFFIIHFFALIIFIPAIIGGSILYSKITKGYVSEFKTSVILKIIKFIDPNLEYNPNQCIPMNIYMESKLFKRTPDRYNGDDLVYGKIDQTELSFSELHTEYKTQTRSSSGGTQTQYHTIFKGLFFTANFNKKFKGETYVMPDVAQKAFGNLLGNLFQSWNKTRGELIKMEDIDFEKLFVVYGSDQIEARYILSTSLMKRITDFKNNTKKDIYLSFLNNKIYVAISYYKNLFEPKIFKTLLDFFVIREYYEDLQMAISLVDELKLNTRIWG